MDLRVISKARIVFSCVRHWVVKQNSENYGSLAQLVERHVYTVDVIGSIPVGPTANPGTARYRGFVYPQRFTRPAYSPARTPMRAPAHFSKNEKNSSSGYKSTLHLYIACPQRVSLYT